MVVYATNVHTGGGKVLLDELLENAPFGPISAAFFDERYKPKSTSTSRTEFYSKKSVISRLLAEFKLHRFLKNTNSEVVLFFGNLPPFFKTKGRSILYLQNCFLTRQVPLPKDSNYLKFRLLVESWLLKLFSKNVNEIWVQTDWMLEATQQYLPAAKIVLNPFLPSFPKVHCDQTKKYKFLYVGSFSLNKRLDFFLDALFDLDQKIKKPLDICIILDFIGPIPNYFQELALKQIKLHVFNNLTRDALALKYCESELFVATSLYESFLLPMYEANFYGNKIILPVAGYSKHLTFPVVYYEIHSKEDLTAKMFSFCD